MPPLLKRIQSGEIDRLSHHRRLTLSDAAHGYGILSKRQDECMKVVMRP